MAIRTPSSDQASQAFLPPAADLFVHNAVTRATFDSFEERLASYINWLHKDRLSSIHMAAAGFYQERPSMDRISCFCCNLALEDWNSNSDPITEHRHASPACTWNNGIYMTTFEERLGSFHGWSIDTKPLPAVMASAGFYHSNKRIDGVTCFSCKLALKDWKRDDDPVKHHLQHLSLIRPCTWLTNVTNPPNPYIPPSPPPTPPAIAIGAIPRECPICLATFPSGNQLTKHGRQMHRNIGGVLKGKRIAVTTRRSGPLLLGNHRVTKPINRRVNVGRRNDSGLYG